MFFIFDYCYWMYFFKGEFCNRKVKRVIIRGIYGILFNVVNDCTIKFVFFLRIFYVFFRIMLYNRYFNN